MLLRAALSAYGSGLSISVLRRLNIEVLAPMPSPSVTIAIAVKPGEWINWRSANCRSLRIALLLGRCGVHDAADGVDQLRPAIALAQQLRLAGRGEPIVFGAL